MSIVWPPALPPSPLRGGYQETQPGNLLRSDMDTGPAKVRRRGNARPVAVTASYILDDDELALLDAFVEDSLAGGALAFDWPHPRLRREVRARLVPQSEGLYTRQPYENTLYWQATLQLEVWPDAPLT